MIRFLKLSAIAVLVLFILPVGASVAWWGMTERPGSWRNANWNSSGLLDGRHQRDEAAILVMAARTGGLKGALSVHSWLLVKKPGQQGYDRYDKVGWGSPVRKNGYAADAFWYSNLPEIVHEIRGERAEALIPSVEKAVRDYPWSARGDYTIWPGPNSNSFVDTVIRAVPGLDAMLPPNAVGKDYRPGLLAVELDRDRYDLHVSFGGLAGFAAGVTSGLELHFLGLVTGIDFLRPAVKLPGFGRFGVSVRPT